MDMETTITATHETNNLDPRTDAPSRPETQVHIAPVQLGQHHRADSGGAVADGGCDQLAIPRDL